MHAATHNHFFYFWGCRDRPRHLAAATSCGVWGTKTTPGGSSEQNENAADFFYHLPRKRRLVAFRDQETPKLRRRIGRSRTEAEPEGSDYFV